MTNMYSGLNFQKRIDIIEIYFNNQKVSLVFINLPIKKILKNNMINIFFGLVIDLLEMATMPKVQNQWSNIIIFLLFPRTIVKPFIPDHAPLLSAESHGRSLALLGRQIVTADGSDLLLLNTCGSLNPRDPTVQIARPQLNEMQHFEVFFSFGYPPLTMSPGLPTRPPARPPDPDICLTRFNCFSFLNFWR